MQDNVWPSLVTNLALMALCAVETGKIDARVEKKGQKGQKKRGKEKKERKREEEEIKVSLLTFFGG